MKTNLYAKLRLTQALFPLLKMNDCARIVNLSSGLGLLRGMGAGDVTYSISKTALNALAIKLKQWFGLQWNTTVPVIVFFKIENQSNGSILKSLLPNSEMGLPKVFDTSE